MSDAAMTGVRPRRRLPRWGFRIFVGLVVASVALNVAPVVFGADCEAWLYRPVEIGTYDLPMLSSAASEVTTVEAPLAPGWVEGVSLPGLVLVADRSNVPIWVHEHVHRIQMQRDGTWGFLAGYGADLVRGKLAGCGAFDSYMAVGYEVEARRVTAQLAADFRRPRSQAGRPGKVYASRPHVASAGPDRAR